MIKQAIRGAAKRFGCSISRVGKTNRFQEMEGVLGLLRANNYDPQLVIDAGANFGQWAHVAETFFPRAEYYLIEPQPICVQALRRWEASDPRIHVQPVAVTTSGTSAVRMTGTGKGGGSGARVADSATTSPEDIQVEATTLDELLAGKVLLEHHAFLKLDLEGHEWWALQGAEQLLPKVEVLLSEVSFYDLNASSRRLFSDLLMFLREREFELFDFASLSPRPRDGRLRMGDAVWVHRGSALLADLRFY